jgi:hypothetical protein
MSLLCLWNCGHRDPDWLASKICQKKGLACHGFGYYLVGDKNLLTSHIWFAKFLAWQILVANQSDPNSRVVAKMSF